MECGSGHYSFPCMHEVVGPYIASGFLQTFPIQILHASRVIFPPPPHSKFKDDFQSRLYMLLGSFFIYFSPRKFKDENVIEYSPAHRMTLHVWCMYAIASQFRRQSTAISWMQFICICITTNSHMDEAVSPCYSGNLLPGILSVRESLIRSMLIRESLARYCSCLSGSLWPGILRVSHGIWPGIVHVSQGIIGLCVWQKE